MMKDIDYDINGLKYCNVVNICVIVEKFSTEPIYVPSKYNTYTFR